MGCLNLRVAGSLAMATAFAATLSAQQPAVMVDDDDITIRGCVREVDLRTTNPSLLVWSRSDLMLVGAEAAGSDAPNPIRPRRLRRRVFYWLDDDEDLAKHVGQQIEIKGDLEDIEKGEIENRPGRRLYKDRDQAGQRERPHACRPRGLVCTRATKASSRSLLAALTSTM